MIQGGVALAIAVVAMATSVSAQQTPTPARPAIPPLEEEVRLALSAAPEFLREGAGVYALTEGGFHLVRPSANGFVCVVNRDHVLSRKPVCYDAEGARTVLPKVLFVGERLLEGRPLVEIERQVEEKFLRGEFTVPARAGVAYMLSPHILNYNPRTGTSESFPPHMMFYAPHVTNADIGTSWDALEDHPWLPFVSYEGPHGFLIVIVPAASSVP